MTSFMLPFGPWDPRSETLVKRAKTFAGEPRVCLFFGAETMETFKCRITSDGNIVTQMVFAYRAMDSHAGQDRKDSRDLISEGMHEDSKRGKGCANAQDGDCRGNGRT